ASRDTFTTKCQCRRLGRRGRLPFELNLLGQSSCAGILEQTCMAAIAVETRSRRERSHSLNRKNCCEPEIGLVTVFGPVTSIGSRSLVMQWAETRLVTDCRAKPGVLVGQVRITSGPARVIVSRGGLAGREMLNIVPLPELPPLVVP